MDRHVHVDCGSRRGPRVPGAHGIRRLPPLLIARLPPETGRRFFRRAIGRSGAPECEPYFRSASPGPGSDRWGLGQFLLWHYCALCGAPPVGRIFADPALGPAAAGDRSTAPEQRPPSDCVHRRRPSPGKRPFGGSGWPRTGGARAVANRQPGSLHSRDAPVWNQPAGGAFEIPCRSKQVSDAARKGVAGGGFRPQRLQAQSCCGSGGCLVVPIGAGRRTGCSSTGARVRPHAGWTIRDLF